MPRLSRGDAVPQARHVPRPRARAAVRHRLAAGHPLLLPRRVPRLVGRPQAVELGDRGGLAAKAARPRLRPVPLLEPLHRPVAPVRRQVRLRRAAPGAGGEALGRGRPRARVGRCLCPGACRPPSTRCPRCCASRPRERPAGRRDAAGAAAADLRPAAHAAAARSPARQRPSGAASRPRGARRRGLSIDAVASPTRCRQTARFRRLPGLCRRRDGDGRHPPRGGHHRRRHPRTTSWRGWRSHAGFPRCSKSRCPAPRSRRGAARRGGRAGAASYGAQHALRLGPRRAAARRCGSRRHTLAPHARSSDAMRTWSRSFLYETVYHVLAVVGRAAGGGAGAVVNASFRGDAAPGIHPPRDRLRRGAGRGRARLRRQDRRGRASLAWSTMRPEPNRYGGVRGRHHHHRPAGLRTIESRGSDVERMLANFRDVVLGKAQPASAWTRRSTSCARPARRGSPGRGGRPFRSPQRATHVASRPIEQVLP